MNCSKDEILKRVNYLVGHLQGVKKMIEEDKYCVDIINQVTGVSAALNKVNQLILKDHLNSCVVEAIKSPDIKKRQKKIGELLKIFGDVQ